VITFIILFALTVSLVGGIVPAYAVESSDSSQLENLDYFVKAVDDVVLEDDEDYPLIQASSLDAIETFVARLYTYIMERPYDATGLAFWSNALRNHTMTGANVAHGFVFSSEFINAGHSDSEFVYRLYRAFMGRNPDQSGREFWERRLYDGWPREDVFAGFANSAEFDSICRNANIIRGTYTAPPGAQIKIFITRMYRTTLDRAPDTTGLNFWFNRLVSGADTGASIARNFVFSPEMINAGLTNEEFVERMYLAMMGRASDTVGRQHWVSRLDSGLPREDVFAFFVSSSEYGRICSDAGITRGTYTPPAGGRGRIYVTSLFREILGIDDPRIDHLADLNHWHNALTAGRETAASVAYSFIFNNTFITPSQSWDGSYMWYGEYIDLLYNALLGRAPLPAERRDLIDLLENGVSRYNVFVRVVNSDEFGRVCNGFGINRGSAPPATNFLAGSGTTAKTWNFIRSANIAGISDRPEHIAGIIGNMMTETGWALCPFQQNTVGNVAGLGIMQWTGARRTALENFMWSNGISQAQFITEMNKHLDGECTYDHPQPFFDRVLEVQINFMFHELRTTENFYMEFVNSPSNRTGMAGARAYAELYCGLVLRPGAGIGEVNNVLDPGVRGALQASPHYGGTGVLNRVSFDRLDQRRDYAAWHVYWSAFLPNHG
jgi:hypothetical protein